MVVSLLLVPTFAIVAVGGFGPMVEGINAVNPTFSSLVRGATTIGVISSVAWGLGYFGQPHIIVRFMALRDAREAKAGRRFGIGWMILSVSGAIVTAMAGIAYFHQHPEHALTDPEAVFLDLAQLFHPFFAGIVLSAVLAAIMSTMSSQMVVTSSALIEDLLWMVSHREYSPRVQLWFGRVGVLVVAIVAVLLASVRNATRSSTWSGSRGRASAARSARSSCCRCGGASSPTGARSPAWSRARSRCSGGGSSSPTSPCVRGAPLRDHPRLRRVPDPRGRRLAAHVQAGRRDPGRLRQEDPSPNWTRSSRASGRPGRSPDRRPTEDGPQGPGSAPEASEPGLRPVLDGHAGPVRVHRGHLR